MAELWINFALSNLPIYRSHYNENRSPTTDMRFVSLDGAGNKKVEIQLATAAPKEDSI
jgi:hypothetical protein